MDYIRIGDKFISISKINRNVDEILELRCRGYSQQEVSRVLNIDRTFISRLESLGEVRKGGDIAVIGFPVANKDELYTELKQAGVDYILLMTEDERNNYAKNQAGRDLFNGILEIISEVRKYQHCIIIGSNMRVKIISSLLNNDIYLVDIGESPLQKSVHVDVDKVLEIVRNIKS
jgi:transcriptional regulator with XRE-family HTH domain